MDYKQEMILIISKYCGIKEKLDNGLEVFIYKEGIEKMVDELVNLLPKHNVSGMIEQIDSLKKFNVEWVNNDGTKVIEHNKDGDYVDANELDKKILSYR